MSLDEDPRARAPMMPDEQPPFDFEFEARHAHEDVMLRAALDYAELFAISVFPCHSATPQLKCTCGRADCKSPAKHPRTKGGFKDASNDPEQIRAWWRQWPDANIGIRTGLEFLVLDVDAPDGDESLAALTKQYGDLPLTAQQLTGGNGRQFFLGYPRGHRISISAGALGVNLDVRRGRIRDRAAVPAYLRAPLSMGQRGALA